MKAEIMAYGSASMAYRRPKKINEIMKAALPSKAAANGASVWRWHQRKSMAAYKLIS
jgi:hypothetical protein